jgi:hypothetical protein
LVEIVASPGQVACMVISQRAGGRCEPVDLAVKSTPVAFLEVGCLRRGLCRKKTGGSVITHNETGCFYFFRR